MAFELTGRLYKKFDTTQITDSFKKREFVVEIEDGAYPQLVKFQLTQNNCDKLDPYSEGDELKVTFSLKGREYTKDGRTSYFTNLDAWRLDGAAASKPPVANANTAAAPAKADDFPTMSDDPGTGFDDDLPF